MTGRFEIDFLPAVHSEMRLVLAKTAETYGEQQREGYKELIALALNDLRENATGIGLPCSEAYPDARLYRIERRGRNAAHMFLYRVRGDVAEIGAFLHVRMDPARHVPIEWNQ